MKVIICGAGQVGWQIARHLASEKNDVTIVEYEILNIKTKRKTKKNLNKANVQIPLTKFRSENPEFLKDDKGFQNIKEAVGSIKN